MNTTNTSIRLGLYGKTALKTISLFLSECRLCTRNIDTTDTKCKYYSAIYVKPDVEADGEICLRPRTGLNYFLETRYSYYADIKSHTMFAHGVDVQYIKHWIADKLRSVTAGMTDNDTVISLHPGSKTARTSRVWEVNATADALDGLDIASKYGKKTQEKVVGVSRDPVITEGYVGLAEEIDKIHADFDNKRDAVRVQLKEQIRAVRALYRKNIAELGKEERRAVSSLKKELTDAVS